MKTTPAEAMKFGVRLILILGHTHSGCKEPDSAARARRLRTFRVFLINSKLGQAQTTLHEGTHNLL